MHPFFFVYQHEVFFIDNNNLDFGLYAFTNITYNINIQLQLATFLEDNEKEI